MRARLAFNGFSGVNISGTFVKRCKAANIRLDVMRCLISYHLYNLKNVENAHGGVLLLQLH